MATIIRIKRSATSGDPATLGAGELAYSSLIDNGSNGGDRLYIGAGTETNGNAANHFVVGGKYFTDMMDHTRGVLTASSAIITDANKKIDNLLVDDLELNANVISSTNDIRLTPTGNVYINNAYTLPKVDGSSGHALVTDGSGKVTFQPISTSINLEADSTTSSLSVLTEKLTLKGGLAIDTSVSGNVFTISSENATTTDKGVAAFASTDFQFLTAGNVSLANVNSNIGSFGSSTAVPVVTVDGKGRVTAVSTAAISTSFTLAGTTGTPQTFNNGGTLSILGTTGVTTAVTANTITVSGTDATTSAKGVASFNTDNFTVTSGAVSTKAVTIGSTSINSGATSTTLAGLTQVDVGNIRLAGSTISTTDASSDLILDPAGNVNVNSSRIRNVGAPVDANDAATKAYVDAVETGLDIKESVRVATTANIDVLSGLLTIDNITLVAGDRILVKNQNTGSENGIYIAASGSWSRAPDADNSPSGEVTAGLFTFVEEGTVNADSGWVLTTNNPITLDTTALTFTQFSGAGQVVAGAGLTKTGNQLDIGGTADRITVNADSIDIASTYAGQSTITTLGTITTGVWNGTTIAATHGGTGHTTTAIGDLLVGAATNTYNKLTVGTAGKVLQSNGTTVVYGDVDGGTY